jgi:mRNA-degrading endonuclease toxin of MazEF toxin-antitoxin module
MSPTANESTLPARGEIWRVRLSGAVGTEVGAKVDERGVARPERPCVVVSDDRFRKRGRITVVPLQDHPRYRALEDAVRMHNEIESSLTGWAARARWAASVRPYQRKVHEAFRKTGEPYDYEFTARNDGEAQSFEAAVDDKAWKPSIVDCGALWTIATDSTQLFRDKPKAKLTDVAFTNIETALEILLSPWSRFSPDILPYQEGDIGRISSPTGTMRLCVVVSCAAIDYLREHIWAHKTEPDRRRRFSNITVVPLHLNPSVDLEAEHDDSVALVSLSGETTVRALANCREVYTIDRRSRYLQPTAFLPISPDDLVKIRRALRIYLGLPTGTQKQ